MTRINSGTMSSPFWKKNTSSDLMGGSTAVYSRREEVCSWDAEERGWSGSARIKSADIRLMRVLAGLPCVPVRADVEGVRFGDEPSDLLLHRKGFFCLTGRVSRE